MAGSTHHALFKGKDSIGIIRMELLNQRFTLKPFHYEIMHLNIAERFNSLACLSHLFKLTLHRLNRCLYARLEILLL